MYIYTCVCVYVRLRRLLGPPRTQTRTPALTRTLNPVAAVNGKAKATTKL